MFPHKRGHGGPTGRRFNIRVLRKVCPLLVFFLLLLLFVLVRRMGSTCSTILEKGQIEKELRECKGNLKYVQGNKARFLGLEIMRNNQSIVDSDLVISQESGGVQPSQETCRSVFGAKGQGGVGEISREDVESYCKKPLLFDACQDLKDFTGLTSEEFGKRMQRRGRFHFEGEHAFWNPNSKTELAWYYASSINYLFANAVHEAAESTIATLASSKEYQPVLEYSGGVGNNVLYLAKRGVRVHYFGIGMAEYMFARYRVMKHGVRNLVEFKYPFAAITGNTFDPINGPLPQDGTLGSILAIDVLEHIPDYHLVVQAMVKSLRVGGVIIERSPFGSSVAEGDVDLRVHLSNGGVSMEEAMGPAMKYDESRRFWRKSSEYM